MKARAVAALATLVAVAALSGCLEQAMGPGGRFGDREFATGYDALSGPRTDRIVIEVHAVQGHVPYAGALAALADELERALPGKQVVVMPPVAIPPTGDAAQTPEDLQAIHERTFTLGDPLRFGDVDAREAWLHVLYVDGEYDIPDGGDAAGLHLSYSNVVILFPDTIGLIAGTPEVAWQVTAANYEAIERTVLVHEAGHALGLVDCGIPMVEPHADPDSRCHSSDPTSVMHSGVGTLQGWMELLQDNTWAPYRYTAQDLADVAAYRAS